MMRARSRTSALLIASVLECAMANPLRTRFEAREVTVTTNHLRNHLASAINRAAYGTQPVIVTRRREEIAALISIEDLAILLRAREKRKEILARELPKDDSLVGPAMVRLLKDEMEYFDQDEFGAVR
jgi:prevent-host-death family protein